MKKLFAFLFFLIPLACLVMSQSKAGDEITKNEKIEILMKHCSNNGMFSGAVLVSENGKIIYKNAFGLANRETKEMIITQSPFYLCSVSKQFTAMAIMILKEENKLSYDDALSKYFKEFPAYANNITIRHLLTHTSGISDHFRLGAYKADLKNSDVLELLIKQDTLNFNPGDKYSYSNGGYVLLAMIAEKASGKPLHIFMKNNIFDKIGMKNTLVFDHSKPIIKNRAIGYNALGKIDDYEILTTGAGGIFSNVDDLFLWDQSLYTDKLVSFKTIDEAFTPAILNDGQSTNYGFGWGINEKANSVQHSGSLSGYRTFIKRDLDKNNAYIFLTNNGNSFEGSKIRNAIDNILENSPYDLPKIKISSKLISFSSDNTIETAINLSRELLNDSNSQYIIDEAGINILGYEFLSENEIGNALAVFKFNIELNPSSWNVFDSMGEAWLMKGDTIEAISNYIKSIQFNPNNTNGIEILSKIGVDVSNLTGKIIISNEVLESFVGKYELTPTLILTISRKDDQLYILPTGQSISEIFPASQTRFYSKIVDAQITFNKNLDGKIISLTLHQGRDSIAKKLE